MILLQVRRTLLALACSIFPLPLAAQVTASLDAGASRTTYADGAGLNAFIASPHVEFNRPWQSLTLDGSFAEFGDAAWSTQGQLRGSVFTPAFARRLRAELLGRAAGTAHQDGAQSGELEGHARLHLIGSRAGAWAGAGAGRAFNGIEWGSEWNVEAGAWMSSSLGTVSLVVTPRAIGSDLRFVEGELVTRTVRGPLELALFGGGRHWTRPSDVSTSLWGGVNAALWLNDHVAITAAGGGYPDDYGQGLPRGRYLTAGVRIATGRSAADLRPDLRRPELPQLGQPVTSDFRTRRVDDDVILELRAPRARAVEMMADFTDWTPVSLVAGEHGWWSLRVPVAAGVHRINVRVDGGAWGVPSGVTTVRDDFGGTVGLIAVGP